VMDANGSAGRGRASGCRAPHLAQKTSLVSTWFPHWLQKGIRNLIRYAKAECSGKLMARKHLQPRARKPGVSRQFPRGRSHLAVKDTDATWFSHSSWSLPEFPPLLESVILYTSTSAGGLLISIFTRPKSMFSL